uniref:Uncharacterized protein n=1 Tax=Romanomermis culicivorax TaxID=13658 RepID=A0A915K3F1_ROMCU
MFRKITICARSIKFSACNKDKQGILMQQSALKKLYPFGSLEFISNDRRAGEETTTVSSQKNYVKLKYDFSFTNKTQLECIGNLCENTVYEIKIHAPERTSDLFTSGSRSQCRSQANKYLLKFLIPSDVQWFENGTPITMFNPYYGSFIAYDGVKNELDETDNVCSNTSFFLFRESPGRNECVSVFYVHEDTLFAIGKIFDRFKLVTLNNSPTIGHGSPANSPSMWCLNAVSEQEVGATKIANHKMPECKYYQHQTSHRGNGTSGISSTKSAPMFAENQMSTKSSSQTTGEAERKRQQCLAKRIM